MRSKMRRTWLLIAGLACFGLMGGCTSPVVDGPATPGATGQTTPAPGGGAETGQAAEAALPGTPVGGLRSVLLGHAMFPDADDITGNGGVGAVFGIDEAGTLWAYPLEAGPRLGQPVLAGTGFAAETLRPIVYQRPFSESSTHGLVGVVCDGLLYRHDVGYDQKVWLAKQIGNGWDGYQVAALGPPAAEYDDAVFDLYGASQLSGDLFLYRNRDGVFQYPYPKTGNGWQGFELWSAGDLNKDGLSDIFGISPAGDLYLYYGSPDGGFTTKSKVGYGWSGFDIAPGTDIDGDKLEDLVSRDAEGRLFFYRGLGEGRFATKVQIADGWGPLDPGPDCSASGPGELVILPWQQPLVAYTFF